MQRARFQNPDFPGSDRRLSHSVLRLLTEKLSMMREHANRPISGTNRAPT